MIAFRSAGLMTAKNDLGFPFRATYAAHRPRATHHSISLCTERKCNGIRSHSGRATRAATAGINSQIVGASNLSSSGRIAFRVVAGAHVGSFAKGRLAQEDRCGLSETGDDMGVSRNDTADESIAASCCLHIVFGGNVILDCEGDTMQWAAHFPRLAFSIHVCGD